MSCLMHNEVKKQPVSLELHCLQFSKTRAKEYKGQITPLMLDVPPNLSLHRPPPRALITLNHYVDYQCHFVHTLLFQQMYAYISTADETSFPMMCNLRR